MKRHESLHPLSQHHHFALMESLFIRRADEMLEADRAATLRKTAEDFLAFWESKGRQHFREEEEILLPAYAAHIDLQQDADVMRMLADHALIRSHIQVLSALVEAKQSLENEIVALGQKLHDHVRLEENVIFPRIEKTLSEAELQQLGTRLSWLHPKKGEACEI